MIRSRRVLIVGSGGREHALAWKLIADGAEVLVAPGNAGTASIAENVPVAATDMPGLLDVARRRGVDLTVVGPEAPLVAGIVDEFTAAGLRIFGPTKRAAQIEGSKSFCKQILHRGDVPTAMFREFRSPARARAASASSSRTIRAWIPRIISARGTWPRETMAAKEPTSTTVEPVRTAKDFILELEAGWSYYYYFRATGG